MEQVILLLLKPINIIKVNKALKEKRVALNEEDVEFFLNEEINFEEYEVVSPKRKKISSALKSDIFCVDDETRSTNSSDAEKTNKQKVSDRLSVENLNIKKRLSISSDLLSNSDILPDKTKSTGGSDEPSKQEPKIENDINI